MNKYQCVFCGKEIEKNKQKATSLLITTNWENDELQEDQQFFCHLKCFKENCYNQEVVYVED